MTKEHRCVLTLRDWDSENTTKVYLYYNEYGISITTAPISSPGMTEEVFVELHDDAIVVHVWRYDRQGLDERLAEIKLR